MPIVSCKLTLNRFPRVRQNFPTAAAHRLSKAADLCVGGAKRRSRVRTGEMRDGWRKEPAGDGWIVANDVPYTFYNEYGTTKMAAQPMLHPASDEVAGRIPGLYAGFEGDL